MPAPIVHLLVIQHGLWGQTLHVTQLAKEAEQRCAKDKEASVSFKYDGPPVASMARKTSVGYIESPDVQLVVYMAKSNQGTHTYDGIDFCAERICDEIDAEIIRIEQSGIGKVRRFSIVGYSLGGLIARYAIGLLHSRTPSFFEAIRPVNFATIASPAIGMARQRSVWGGLKHFYGARLLSRTGRQIHLADRFQNDKPLLLVMTEASSSFHQALAAFERIDIYANVAKDLNVGYSTGVIAEHDPFGEALAVARAKRAAAGIPDEVPIADLREGGLEIVTDPNCPPIVLSYTACESIAPIVDANAPRKQRQIMPRFLRPSSYPWWPPAVRYIFVGTFPIVLPLFLVFAASLFTYQSTKSGKRIRALRRRASLSSKISRLNRVGLKETMDEAVDVTVAMTTEASTDTLPDKVVEDAAVKRGPHDAILAPSQIAMIKNLNAINGVKKHLVWFPQGFNGHAMIVCRDPAQYPAHEQGRAVLRHWCDGFRL